MKAALVKYTRLFHRYLALIVGIQILLWIIGGVFMAIVPFQEIVKSRAVYENKPAPIITEHINVPLSDIVAQYPSIDALQLVNLQQHLYYQIQPTGQAKVWVSAEDGVVKPKIDSIQASLIAKTLYKGEGQIDDVRFIDEPLTKQWLIVDELYGRTQLWQVRFNDDFNTRLYIAPISGELVTVRNDAWVWFDFLWRLHIMDYQTGEDFNNNLLRVAAVLALLAAVSGLILMTFNVIRPKLRRVQRQLKQD
ncbi:PepSY domain-containing protein [Catenovulum sp. SM1970]|uniref:PepSY domain-containing protein n=1 Tax=Marinifaba aquimaris TaxID=2741323 RepID=UPI0015740081|nr:PepSY domain-containing protein [Marinifaba aquimaris]NTS76248.1 PepSY domain-containing protein [Marinifaba aquimaris]